MKADSLIEEAHRLLRAGEETQARELLLVEGFIKDSVAEIQEAFLSLFPVLPPLQKMLDGPYQKLHDTSEVVRMSGLTQIAREIAREVPLDGVRWMRDPRASRPLIAILDDENKKVADRALFTLGRLIWRYFPDQRAETPLFLQLQSDDQHHRVLAISALVNLRRESVIEKLLPVFNSGTEQDCIAILSAMYGVLSEDWVSFHQIPLRLSASGSAYWVQMLNVIKEDGSEPIGKLAAAILELLTQ